MSEGMFETPNTRSRRRREDDAMASGSSGSKPMGSQEDERVYWVHDQRLRRAVLSATEHVELAPPTPTQRPRPLSSSRPAGSSSSRPPRKRPCRNSRSEPNGSGSKAKQSSSLPNKNDEAGLDMLLKRFELLSTPLPSSRASLPSATARSASAGVLRDQQPVNGNTLIPESPNMSSPVTRSATSLGKRSLNAANGDMVPSTPYADSPLKARASAKPTSMATSRQTQKPFPAGQQKPFKPPFLNPPLRSSPRHLRTNNNSSNNAIPPSPLRAAIPVPSEVVPTFAFSFIPAQVTAGNKAKAEAEAKAHAQARHPPVHVAETPCRGQIRKHNANVDIGEDDPAGDSSFDSFDGMFQDGGPEIEQLLKAVDGSQ